MIFPEVSKIPAGFSFSWLQKQQVHSYIIYQLFFVPLFPLPYLCFSGQYLGEAKRWTHKSSVMIVPLGNAYYYIKLKLMSIWLRINFAFILLYAWMRKQKLESAKLYTKMTLFDLYLNESENKFQIHFVQEYVFILMLLCKCLWLCYS